MNLSAHGGVPGTLPPSRLGASAFPVTADLSRIISYPGWHDARERVLAALRAGRHLVLITGAPGTGKTLLLRDVARCLEMEGVDVLLQGRGDVPASPVPAAGGGRRRIVLVDEADRINGHTLQGLRSSGAAAVALVVSRVPSREGETVVRLAPLSREDARAFVRASLTQAGLSADLVDEAAVERLWQRSEGMPRQLNILASAAVMLAEGDGSRSVRAEHVDGAVALRAALSTSESLPPADNRLDRAAPLASRRQRRVWPAVAAGMAVASVCVGVILTADLVGKPQPPRRIAAATVPADTLSSPSMDGGSSPATPSVTPSRPSTPDEAPALAAEPQVTPPSGTELPAGAPVLVAVRFDRSAGTAPFAERIAGALRDAGFMVDGPAPTVRRGSRPGAHYVFAEDEKAAEAVLRTIGLSDQGIIADAAGSGIPVRPGTVELVVPPSDAAIQSSLETERSEHP